MHAYWQKQTSDKPLFPDLVWSRPETRAQAGKLLIVGGNAHSLAAPAAAYEAAGKAGIGTVRVILPDSLQKTVGRVFEAGEYAPSTPSGSFGQRSLAELCATAVWADSVLVAGDLGRNSETAIMLEQFVQKYTGQLTLTQDALDYFTKAPGPLLEREDTLIVASFAQLQKLATAARFTAPFTFDMDFLKLIENLHNFTTQHQLHVITKHLDTILVAVNGQVSTTKLAEDHKVWRVKTAAAASVWWLQNPGKPCEALTTSLVA
jgi:hypothetical protein